MQLVWGSAVRAAHVHWFQVIGAFSVVSLFTEW